MNGGSRLAAAVLALAVTLVLGQYAWADGPTETPANLHVTATTATSLSVAWDAPTTAYPQESITVTGPAPGPPDARPLTGGTSQATTVADPYTWTQSGLVCGSTYTVAVAWIDGSGIAGPAASIQVTTMPCTTLPPAAPTGLTPTVLGNDVVFDWDAAPGDAVGVYFRYGSPNSAPPSAETVDTSGAAWVDDGYDPGTVVCGEPYTITIAWVNAEGLASSPATASATAADCSPTEPGPTGLAVDPTSRTHVNVTWAAYQGTDLWYTRVSATGGDPFVYRGKSYTSARVSGLQCGTSYTFTAQWVFTDGSVSLPSTVNGSTALCPLPGVSSVSIRGVSETGATVSGGVNPEGSRTTYYFAYGPTSALGSGTPTQDAGAGTTPVPVSAAIAGLQPGTTYYVALVATSATGTRTGSVNTFRTSSPPPPPPVVQLKCVVPRLVGLTIAKAKRALIAHHCRPGKVKLKRVAKKKLRHKVLRSTPPRGTKAPAGTKVALLVGK